MARPLKYPDEPLVTKALKFPPSLWARLEELIPQGERAAFVREAVERRLVERETDASRKRGDRKEARIRMARGALAHTGAGVEAFCREKQEEIDLEERRLTPQAR